MDQLRRTKGLCLSPNMCCETPRFATRRGFAMMSWSLEVEEHRGHGAPCLMPPHGGPPLSPKSLAEDGQSPKIRTPSIDSDIALAWCAGAASAPGRGGRLGPGRAKSWV